MTKESLIKEITFLKTETDEAMRKNRFTRQQIEEEDAIFFLERASSYYVYNLILSRRLKNLLDNLEL